MHALRRHWPLLLMWLLISAVLVYGSWDRIITRTGWDPDDQLRLVQLRDFLAGQSWSDSTQYRMNVPDGAPMHWSRLVELPLAFVVMLLSPLLGSARAEMIAGVVVPLSCLGGTAFLLSRVAERIGGRAAGIAAFLLTLIAPALLIQLRPMRIDHHGWQIFCAALSLAALFCENQRKSGLVLGAALAVWIHISLEGAPMTAAFFLLVGWRWIVQRDENVRLFWTLCSFAAVSMLLFLGTQPMGIAAAQYCDTVSPMHIWAILGAIAVLVPAIHLKPKPLGTRLAVAGAAGAVAVSLLGWLEPICFSGAFADLDPVVRDYWYSNITEGLPVWRQDLDLAVSLITPLVVALVALYASFRIVAVEQRKALRMIGFFLVYASLLSFLVVRTISVATAFTIVPAALCLAAVAKTYPAEPKFWRRMALVGVALILMVSSVIAGTIIVSLGDETTDQQSKAEPKREARNRSCKAVRSVTALGALPKANMVAPFDMGPAVLMTTSHAVLASNHHRNRTGMRDQIDIFRLSPAKAKAILMRRSINYLITCPGEAEMENYAERAPDGLWAQLDKGETPDWLEYQGTYGKGIKVWRVR
jgi:hypothetical protein